MPTYRKCAPFCLPHNQPGLVGINRNNLCDGYFGCDNEEIFLEAERAVLSNDSNKEKQHSHLPWVRRKSPPVLSFFKRIATLNRKQATPKKNNTCNGYSYRTLPNPKTNNFNVGYKCFPFDAGFTSLKLNYFCDGYFGCPPTK